MTITNIKQLTTQLTKIVFSLFSTVIWFALPQSVWADTPSVVGTIEPPPGVDKWQAQVGDNDIGIILFLSNMIRLITIVAGIWTMLNFIFAGWIYLTSSGDSSAGEKVSTKMLNSVIGLAIVAFSYTIAAIVGLLIFGDATFIINPKLTSIGG